MLRLAFFIVTLWVTVGADGQTNKRIEIEITRRYDKHADYTTRYGDRSYTNDMKLWGSSGGIQLKYQNPLTKNVHLTLGAGYFRLSIDKIRSTTPWANNVPGRSIDYNHPTGIQPAFHTDKYGYNNIALSAGVHYEKLLSGKTTLTFDADYTYLYTFSQTYRITYDQTKSRTNNGKNLGFTINSGLGILQTFNGNTYYLNPKLLLPIYQQLAGDRVFREDENMKIGKWMNGVGLSIAIGKYL